MRPKHLILVLLTCAAALSQSNKTVTVEGCPVPGVEGGCLVVTGADGKVWEISSANPRPKTGAHAISLTGQISASPSTCMQGTKLDHIQWKYTEAMCQNGSATK